jgi:thymidine phosphorylase
VFHRHVTDRIEAGDVLCTLYARSTEALDQAEQALDGAFTISQEEPEPRDHIYEEVSTE